MKTTVLSVFGITALIILIGCDGNNLSNSTGSNPLEGTWSESFEWYDLFSPWVDYTWGSGGPIAVNRTSTITFSGNEFTVMVLPHRRGFISTPDSVYIGTVDDTLYVGTYWFIHDTIWFYQDGVDRPTSFEYSIDSDGLHLTENTPLYIDPETGATVVSFYGPFLWAHSSRKASGLFTKVRIDHPYP